MLEVQPTARTSGRAWLAALSLFLGACATPDVQFSEDRTDATADVAAEGAVQDDAARPSDDGPTQSEDAPLDALDLDVDTAPYCYGNAPPPGGKCCPNDGGACFGSCNKNSCGACGPCSWPEVCCTQGPSGKCQSAPCPPKDAGGSGGGDGGADDAAGTDAGDTDAGSG